MRTGLALGLSLISLAFTGCGGDDKKSSTTATTAAGKAVPSLASEDELKAYSKTLEHPLYWAGPRQNYSYELTKTSDGSSYIRYLPQGVSAGDPRPIFLTIGTYPRDNAFGIVQAAAKQHPGSAASLPNGGLGVPSPRNPKSVYMSFPKSPVLVEVFSTDPQRSMRLVRQQAIVPVQ